MRGVTDHAPDLSDRLRAAITYGRLGRQGAADAMDVSPGTLDRYTARTPNYAPSDQQLLKLANAANLPYEFFTADWSRMREIVPAGRFVQAADEDPRERATRVAAESARDSSRPRGKQPTSSTTARDRDAADASRKAAPRKPRRG